MLGPETVAGFLTEPAQGAGMIHPPKEYFPQIREMTQRLGILWLDDEVMTGFGRLGEWFGYKCYDVTPDIMSVAKGLISSALPAGGVVLSQGGGGVLRQMALLDHEHFRLAPTRHGGDLRQPGSNG